VLSKSDKSDFEGRGRFAPGDATSPRWGEVKQAMQARATTGRGLFRRRVLPERRAARKPLVKNLRLKL
jgi:hypothetical protein